VYRDARGAVVVTYNDGVGADTFNIGLCPWQSPWCARYCYGRKLRGLAYSCDWHADFEWGSYAKKRGFFRPFTVEGDVPKTAQDRRRCTLLLRKLLPQYDRVWLPTRAWSDTRGLPYLHGLMEEHENVRLTLSYDGSMNLQELRRVAQLLSNRFPERIGATVVVDAPYTPLFEQRNVDALMNLGSTPCTKTNKNGECDDCGRICWNGGAKLNGMLEVPLVALKFHP